jgi:hypothetical protein
MSGHSRAQKREARSEAQRLVAEGLDAVTRVVLESGYWCGRYFDEALAREALRSAARESLPDLRRALKTLRRALGPMSEEHRRAALKALTAAEAAWPTSRRR